MNGIFGRVTSVSLLALMQAVMLAACGGGGTGSSTPPPSGGGGTTAPTGDVAVISAVGSPVGSPVQTTIGSGGATLTAGTAVVQVPAGAMSGGTVTLQPITDTLNGTGQGIEISSDTAWSQYLTVSLPIEPGDGDPQALGLAVQQADGSWRALEPVVVDTVAGTVSAGLPAGAASASAAGAGRAQAMAASPGSPTRVSKFLSAYLKPGSGTVKVKGSLTFTAWARMSEQRGPGCTLPTGTQTGADALAPLLPSCWFTVIKDKPFLNTLDGYRRAWLVNDMNGGDATVGTVAAQGASNGVYTAPSQVPPGGVVTVSFLSQWQRNFIGRTVKASAQVRIVDGDFAGEISGSSTGSSSWAGAFPYSFSKIALTLNLDPKMSTPPYSMTYKGTGTGSITLPKGTLGNLTSISCDSLTLQATFDTELTVATMKADGTPLPAGTGTQSLHVQVRSSSAAVSRCWPDDQPDLIRLDPIDIGASVAAILSGCGGADYVPPSASDITQLSGQIVDLACSLGPNVPPQAPFSLSWQFTKASQ